MTEATETNQSNIDSSEIEKFNALASRWWDKNSEFKPLHEINPLRLGFVEQHCKLVDQNCLDIGCGGGIVSEGLAHRGGKVTGIDMAKDSLAVARLHLLESKLDIQYEQITAEEYAHKHPNSFEVITCLEMLEHVPSPASVIDSCASLLKPGGKVFFSTINRNPKAYLFAILGAEYLLNLLPKGTHDYQKFIKPSELSSWARNAGLELETMTGMTYNPVTKRYKLEPDVNVNYLMCFSKTA